MMEEGNVEQEQEQEQPQPQPTAKSSDGGGGNIKEVLDISGPYKLVGVPMVVSASLCFLNMILGATIGTGDSGIMAISQSFRLLYACNVIALLGILTTFFMIHTKSMKELPANLFFFALGGLNLMFFLGCCIGSSSAGFKIAKIFQCGSNPFDPSGDTSKPSMCGGVPAMVAFSWFAMMALCAPCFHAFTEFQKNQAPKAAAAQHGGANYEPEAISNGYNAESVPTENASSA